MRFLTWIKSLFARMPSCAVISGQLEQLIQLAAPVIAQVEVVKNAYKSADDVNAKRNAVLGYVADQEVDQQRAVRMTDQLLYCPAAALWTELAVMGLRTLYPQATGHYLRAAIVLAYAIAVESKSKDQPE
jgi:hypothetical protein